MKKHIALLLALLLSFAPLTGCATAQLVDPSDEAAQTDVSVAVGGETAATEGGGETAVTQESADPQGEALGPAVTGAETVLLGDTVVDEEGWYSDKYSVALYLLTYGALPGNFITKDEARALGWEGGSLEPYAPGHSIGGDRFGNYEGSLPAADGRTYTECDIDTQGADERGAKRIVFSNDGLVFYTEDHYQTFTLIQGEE